MPSVLQLLKLSAAAPAPQAPEPPPNNVRGPKVSIPRVNGDAVPGAKTDMHKAHPLAPEMYEGELLPPEEIQARQLAAQEQAEWEAKNAPKETKAPKPPDPEVSVKLLARSLGSRLSHLPQPKMATTAGLVAPYNPFEEGTWMNKGYRFGKSFLLNPLLQKKPHGMLANLSSLQNRNQPWVHSYARHRAEIASPGVLDNPLLALGANFLGSVAGGNLDAAQLNEFGTRAQQSFS